MEQKEQAWLKKRCGRPTSSKNKVLFVGGSRPATEEEIAIYKLVKSTRKTVDLEFGDTALEYFYELAWERESGIPTYTPSNRNFDWGSTQEPYAVKWVRANHPEFIVRHCSSEDFDDIVFNVAECGLGDSPDIYYRRVDEVVENVGEIKCVMGGAKLKRIKEMSKDEARVEHEYQFSGHFIGKPDAVKLLYVVYLGQNDDDPNDVLDPLDSKRGVVFEYDRSEFQDLIEQIEAKVKFVVAFLDVVDRGELKPDGKPWRVRDINEFKG